MNQICLCSQQQELHYYFLWFDLLKQNNWIAYGKELNCFIILVRSDSSNRFDIRWCQTIKLFHKDKSRFGFGYFFVVKICVILVPEKKIICVILLTLIGIWAWAAQANKPAWKRLENFLAHQPAVVSDLASLPKIEI
jgi:hypothetical protein